MNKPSDNPADPFKKALAEATKVMADDPDLTVSYSVDPPGMTADTVRLPQVSRRMTREEVLLARGTADAFALRRKFHDDAVAAKYAPQGQMARDLFDAMENARVEAVGARYMPGTAGNIDAKIANEARRKGYDQITQASDAPLSVAAGYLIRQLATGRPLPVDWDEPDRVARSIQRMKIKHAVLTSVDRDDLADGGSIIWAETVAAVRRLSPGTTMETLIPDFRGITDQIDRIVEAAPEVVSHNMETVRRLTRQVRIQAQYDRSLEVLRYLKANGVNRTKTGIMLGLGETEDELYQTLDDVRSVGVDVVTLGQYLQPSPRHLPVQRFVEPEEFERLGAYARTLGFRHVESSPLVRSSYHAERHVH